MVEDWPLWKEWRVLVRIFIKIHNRGKERNKILQSHVITIQWLSAGHFSAIEELVVLQGADRVIIIYPTNFPAGKKWCRIHEMHWNMSQATLSTGLLNWKFVRHGPRRWTDNFHDMNNQILNSQMQIVTSQSRIKNSNSASYGADMDKAIFQDSKK